MLETIWKTFEITGSIDAYMCYKEMENIAKKDFDNSVEDK